MHNILYVLNILRILAEDSDATGLHISVGQFITAAVFIVTSMAGIGVFSLKTFSSYSTKVNGNINEMKTQNALTEQRVKALEDNRAENRQTLGEIKDTLNKVNTKVEVILSKSVIFNNEDKGK